MECSMKCAECGQDFCAPVHMTLDGHDFVKETNRMSVETTVIKTEKYTRKPFDVEAVQVADDNIDDVAKWCDGEVRTTGSGAKYIKVNVNRPLTDRQTQAFLTDWVLKAGTGFKVYIDKAFKSTFVRA